MMQFGVPVRVAGLQAVQCIQMYGNRPVSEGALHMSSGTGNERLSMPSMRQTFGSIFETDLEDDVEAARRRTHSGTYSEISSATTVDDSTDLDSQLEVGQYIKFVLRNTKSATEQGYEGIIHSFEDGYYKVNISVGADTVCVSMVKREDIELLKVKKAKVVGKFKQGDCIAYTQKEDSHEIESNVTRVDDETGNIFLACDPEIPISLSEQARCRLLDDRESMKAIKEKIALKNEREKRLSDIKSKKTEKTAAHDVVRLIVKEFQHIDEKTIDKMFLLPKASELVKRIKKLFESEEDVACSQPETCYRMISIQDQFGGLDVDTLDQLFLHARKLPDSSLKDAISDLKSLEVRYA